MGLALPRAALLEAVEDQVQAELELVAVVIPRLQDVLGRQLGEVGKAWAGNCSRKVTAISAVSSGLLKGRLSSCIAKP